MLYCVEVHDTWMSGNDSFVGYAVTIFTNKESLKDTLKESLKDFLMEYLEESISGLVKKESLKSKTKGYSSHISGKIVLNPFDHIKWSDKREYIEDISLDDIIDKGVVVLGDGKWMSIKTTPENPKKIFTRRDTVDLYIVN